MVIFTVFNSEVNMQNFIMNTHLIEVLKTNKMLEFFSV